jgi:hypothetical protein
MPRNSPGHGKGSSRIIFMKCIAGLLLDNKVEKRKELKKREFGWLY